MGEVGRASERSSWTPHQLFRNSVWFGFPLLRRVGRFRAWTAARGHARAARITVIPALIFGMIRLVTNGIATSGKFGNFHACGVLGKFVRLFPQSDFRSFESQFFMTQDVKLGSLGSFHLLDPTVHIQ